MNDNITTQPNTFSYSTHGSTNSKRIDEKTYNTEMKDIYPKTPN